jgi:PAS domain S-box-containing protein
MDLHPGPENRRPAAIRLSESYPLRRAFQENEDWYQDLVEHSHDLLCIHDLEGRLLSINPRPAQLLGYSVEEILQIPMRNLVPPEYRSQFDAYLRQIESTGEAHGIMEVMTRSGGRRIWEYHNTLRSEGVEEPIVRGIAHDVTEQRDTEKRMRELSDRLLTQVREGDRSIRELRLFRTLVDQCNEAIEVVDPETLRFLDVNEKACSELGYSREELLAMGVYDINPTAGETVEKIREELGKSGSLMRETVHRRKDGSTFPVEVSLSRVQIDRDYVVAIARDVTERKRAEKRLKEYERVVESLEENIVVVDSDYRYVIANRAFLNYRGLEKEQVLGHRVPEIVDAEFFDKVIKDRMDECFSGKAVHYEFGYRYPTLGERRMQASYFPVEGQDGIDRIAMILRDVTERKKAEDRLKEYERAVEGLEEMITVIDRDYRFIIANQAFAHHRRTPKEQLIGRVLFEQLRSEGTSEAVMALIKQKLDECFEGRVVQYEMKFKYPHLGERDLIMTYMPIEGPLGIDRIASVTRDVTEQKQAEEELREAKEFSENLIRTANMIILSLDTEGNITLLNEAAEEITGYTFSELRGKNWSILAPRDRFPHVWEEFDKLMDGTAGLTFENPILTKNSEERYVAWRNNQVKVNGAVVATISFGNDITERKQAEEALRRSEENYRLFVSRSSEGIFREEMESPVSVDLAEDELVHRILYDTYIAECNDALAAMYGFASAEQLRGKSWKDLASPDDPQNIELTRQYVRSGFRVIDHESHEVDVHGNAKVFLNSQVGTVENGMLVGTWGIQRDITEKVRLEKERLQAEDDLRHIVRELSKVTAELAQAKEKLSEEKLYLEEAIDSELGFGEIIGRSGALKDVMQKVAKVAPSDASVLLLGETGTGKELVARAVHRMSQRNGKSFIKLNCAAIPSGLLESELFGHERGAFTGAVARKLGRLELADKGTLFLDEIGEIPLSLQPKLLRVLQDMEFERLGSTQTLKVNFRLLAATNRDLLQSVKMREFRSDLYYRLNVFPIVIPPLRERREDIRPLVEHFVRKFSQQMKKSITSIPASTMEMLVRWDWPGNIRELENFVERSVILSPGSVLQSPLPELEKSMEENGEGTSMTLREKDRERILQALRECGGRLGGPDGAAARLGLKRTTLQSKLDHLGIKPAVYRA